jgi:hypothetical protein
MVPAIVAWAQPPAPSQIAPHETPLSLSPPTGPLAEPLWGADQVLVGQDGSAVHRPAHSPSASGCGCPACAAGAHGPAFQPLVEHAPMYAPTQLEFAESWLPEVNEDWYGRPLAAGAFGGAFLGDELIEAELELKPGLFTGLRFGGEYDRRWSYETRLAYGHSHAVNLHGPQLEHEVDLFLAHSNLIYSRIYGRRLRPYASAGMGVTYLDTIDHLGRDLREFLPTIPVGVGAQYRLDEWFALHLDLHDQILLGGHAGLALMHNLTLAAGVEFRFGGSPNTYYPWNPARNMW